MIDFKTCGYEWKGYDAETKKLLKLRSDDILKDLNSLKTDKFYLGVHLIDLYNSKAFRVKEDELRELYTFPFSIGNTSALFFFAYCNHYFGLDKSCVSRYMNIVDEFGDGLISLKEKWKNFSYSQLVEMLPLTENERSDIRSDWTIKQIREYKKDLAVSKAEQLKFSMSFEEPANVVATSQQTKPTVQSVATSQQDNAISEYDPEDIQRYKPFLEKSRMWLYERIIALEYRLGIRSDFGKSGYKYSDIEKFVETFPAAVPVITEPTASEGVTANA